VTKPTIKELYTFKVLDSLITGLKTNQL